MAYMKTPQYCSNLQQLLEQEKVISKLITDITDLLLLLLDLLITISCQHLTCIQAHVICLKMIFNNVTAIIFFIFFIFLFAQPLTRFRVFLSVSSKNTGTCLGRQSSSTLSVSRIRTRSKVSFRPN